MKRIIKLIIYYFAYNFGFGLVFLVGYFISQGSFDMEKATADPAYFSATMWAQALAALAVGMHLIGWKYVERDQLTARFPQAGKMFLAALVLIIGMGCWTNYLTELTELPDIMKETFRQAMNHPVGILSIVVLAPVVEELLFRGAMQGHLMRIWKNPRWGILVSALVFGLIHGNPVQIVFAFILGLALGWMYYRTGSLLPCILMHFVNNGTSVLLFHLAGGKDETMVEALGETGAMSLAAAGFVLTILAIAYVNACTKKVAPAGNPEPLEK